MKNCLLQAISPFSHNFFYLIWYLLSILNALWIWSAICFNLDQSKILSSGNELNLLFSTLSPLNFNSHHSRLYHRLESLLKQYSMWRVNVLRQWLNSRNFKWVNQIVEMKSAAEKGILGRHIRSTDFFMYAKPIVKKEKKKRKYYMKLCFFVTRHSIKQEKYLFVFL